jgi:hypothetical protein
LSILRECSIVAPHLRTIEVLAFNNCFPLPTSLSLKNFQEDRTLPHRSQPTPKLSESDSRSVGWSLMIFCARATRWGLSVWLAGLSGLSGSSG